MTRTTTLFLAAAMLTLAMAACSVMAYPDKQQGPGPCASGYYPDDRGCCPAIIQGKPYYRDSNKCYPVGVGAKGVLYADSFGCYPDEQGRYLAAQETCPKGRRCEASCLEPEPKYQWDNNNEEDHHWMDQAKEDPTDGGKSQLPLDDKKGQHHKPANNNNGGGQKKGGMNEGDKKKRPIDEHRKHEAVNGKKGSH